MGVVLTTDLVVGAGYRLLVLGIAASVAISLHRRHHWPVWLMLATGIASNIYFLLGDLRASAVCAVPYVGLISWIAIEYMRHDVSVLRALLSRKEASWSRERHDLINDKAALQARVYIAERDIGAASDET